MSDPDAGAGPAPSPGPLAPALLAPLFWPEVRRGTERAVRLLADGLLADGHRPRLVVGHAGRRPTRAVEDGLEVLRLPRTPERWAHRQQRDELARHCAALRAWLLLDPPQLAHAFYPADALAVARTPVRRRPPLVVSVMGPPDRAWAVARRDRLTALVEGARAARVVTSLGRFAADRLWRTFAIRSEIVPPPVDLDAFSVDPAADRTPEPRLLFASDAGSGAKRIGLLLDALALLRRDRPTLGLLVSRPSDPGLARDLAGVDGVDVADLDDHAALRDAFRRSWVTVLPSMNEAFGLVVAESLACGTPAVACAGEGPAEILEAAPGAGAVAPEATAESLAGAIAAALELAADPGVRERCRAGVRDLGVAAHAARNVELYRRALGHG